MNDLSHLRAYLEARKQRALLQRAESSRQLSLHPEKRDPIRKASVIQAEMDYALGQFDLIQEINAILDERYKP